MTPRHAPSTLPDMMIQAPAHLLTSGSEPSDFLAHRWFALQAARTPTAPAVSCGPAAITYRALDQQANQLAQYLQRHGIGSEVPVGLCVERSLDLVVGILAIWKSGGVYVPLDPEYPRTRITATIDQAQPALILTRRHLGELFPTYQDRLVNLPLDSALLTADPAEDLNTTLLADHLAYMVATSGSTGAPKLIAVEHRSLAAYLASLHTALALPAQARVLQLPSFAFDASLRDTLIPLLSGATVVLLAPNVTRTPEAVLAALTKHRITALLSLVPTMLRALCVAARGRPALTLERVVLSGEPLDWFDVRAAREIFGSQLKVINQYGPSECTLTTTIDSLQITPLAEGRTPLGEVLQHAQIYLLDPALYPVESGVTGEIYIGGAGVARAYIGQAQLTAERFVPDPFSRAAGARMYRTGDLGRRDEAGQLLFVGRIDRQLKIRGVRVEPGDIEAVLRSHPAVKASAVIGRQSDDQELRLVAYVVLDQSSLPDDTNNLTANSARRPDMVQAIRQHLAERLHTTMMPSEIVVLATLPLTLTGKIDYRALSALGHDASAEHNYVAPRTEHERVLVEIWSEVLRVKQLGIYENFFELGGHSLTAMQIISRIHECLHVSLPLHTMFDGQEVTVVAQAALVEALEREHVAEFEVMQLPPIARQSIVPASFAQQRLWLIEQLAPGNTAYNMCEVVRLYGQLDAEILEWSLNQIVSRHDVLRTTFEVVDGQPVQRIAPTGKIPLTRVALAESSPDERERAIAQLIRVEQHQPFDLAAGPLLRVMLCTHTPQEHMLILSVHHIVADAWSIDLLFHELASLYASRVASLDDPLPTLPIQYADYTLWQRQQLHGPPLHDKLDFWKRYMDGAPAVLSISPEFTRPSEPTFCGAQHGLTISPELCEALRRIGHHHGATLFMVLLAAFKILLTRRTSTRDIVVGTAVAGRDQRVFEGLIGLFVNILPLRTRIPDGLSFEQVLALVRATTLDALSHADVPFEQIVSTLQPTRALNRTPIVQVMFELERPTSYEWPGLGVHFVELARDTAKFDLTLRLHETAGGLQGAFEYNRDVVQPEGVERMAEEFLQLLDHIVADSSLPMSGGKTVHAQRALQERQARINKGSVEPRNEVERILVAIWAQVLGAAPSSVHDNFFDLGGHSLHAARVCYRLQEQLGVEIPLRAIFETPDLASLAERILSAQHARPNPPEWRIAQADPAEVPLLLTELERLSNETIDALLTSLEHMPEVQGDDERSDAANASTN
jgi:amino acid adenylation domain-containing protein